MENISQQETINYFPKNPILFRFTFIFISLFILVFNNGTFLPLTLYPVLKWPPLEWAVNWIGKTFFYVEHTLKLPMNGSGDTSFHWYSLIFILLLSLMGTLIWSVLPRKANNYNKLYYWLTVFVRYYLGLMLIHYGFVKFQQSQFPFPGYGSLTTPLSELGLMRLAWSFFGASHGYNIFIGIAEVAGVLLLFRKTATLGAMVSLVTAINIMAINYFYNVPVKMVSTALVLFSLYLLAPNIIRIFQFLVLQQQTSILSFPKLQVKSKILKGILIGVKWLIIVSVFVFSYLNMTNSKKYMANYISKDTDFYGVYYLSPSQDENRKAMGIPEHWERLIFEYKNQMSSQNVDLKTKMYNIEVNKNKKEIRIISPAGEKGFHASYIIGSNGNITLTDLNSEKPVQLILTKMDMEDIPLKNNRFNWIIGD